MNDKPEQVSYRAQYERRMNDSQPASLQPVDAVVGQWADQLEEAAEAQRDRKYKPADESVMR